MKSVLDINFQSNYEGFKSLGQPRQGLGLLLMYLQKENESS